MANSLPPHDCSPPVSSVRRIFQARILEWVAIPFCRGSKYRPLKQFYGQYIEVKHSHCAWKNVCKEGGRNERLTVQVKIPDDDISDQMDDAFHRTEGRMVVSRDRGEETMGRWRLKGMKFCVCRMNNTSLLLSTCLQLAVLYCILGTCWDHRSYVQWS